MRKNSKGFTLIELLASMVLLGILFALGLPAIVQLVSNSREKMFISDAKAMIALTEYKMRSRSIVIEKPSAGDCIVFSLNYLDNSDFDDTPNRGEYMKFSSFVVVKNVGGNMEYSVNLVEKKDNAYKGIVLSTLDDLKKKSTKELVKTIKKSELVSVEGVGGLAILNESFINSNLKENTISLIESTYNYPDSGGYDISSDDVSTPVIKRATLSSTSLKAYNSLDTTLTIEVTDEDTPLHKIKVYYKYTAKANEDFPIPGTDTAHGYCTGNDCKIYTEKIDLSTVNNPSNGNKKFTYGDTVYLNVLVEDDEGNQARKRIQYPIHTNKPPEFEVGNEGSVTKRPEDLFNLYKAIVHINVKDDMDDLSELRGCVLVDPKNKTCPADKIKPYNDLFDAEGNYNIDFCTKNCYYNESVANRTKKVVVVMIDTLGASSSAEFEYELYHNDAPSVNVSMTSNYETFLADSDKKSLTATVVVTVDDDLTLPENISYEYYDKRKPNDKKTGKFPDNGILQIPSFTFSGSYDGLDRTFVIKVYDEFNLSNDADNQEFIYSNVYVDDLPKISDFKITGNDKVCDHCTIGYGNPGALKVKYSYNIVDDITPKENLRYCISERENTCKSDSNYVNYETFMAKADEYTFSASSGRQNTPYDGTSRKLYLFVTDRTVTGSKPGRSAQASYTLYNNTAPKLVGVNVVSANEDLHDFNTYVSFEVEDDLTLEGDIQVELSVKNKDSSAAGIHKYSNTIKMKYSEMFEESSLYPFKVGKTYGGDTMLITIKVTDSYNVSTSQTMEYRIFNNAAPVIKNFSISRLSYPCTTIGDPDYLEKKDMCDGNSYGYVANIEAEDINPDDSSNVTNDLLMCISDDNAVDGEGKNFCDDINNYVEYSTIYSGFLVAHLDKKEYEEANDVRSVSLHVRDLLGEEVTNTKTYKIYENQGPSIVDDSVKVESRASLSSNPVVAGDPTYNTMDVDFTVKAIDEFDDEDTLGQKICYRIGNNISEICASDDYVAFSETTTVYLRADPNSRQYSIYSYIVDSHGKFVTTDAVSYEASENKGPTINSFSVESQQKPCDKTYTKNDEEVEICPLSSGGTNTYIAKIDAMDSEDDLSDLSVCISDVQSDCTTVTDNEKFVGYTDSYELEITNPSEDYTQTRDSVTIYAAVADSSGNITHTNTIYKLYQNHAPVVTVDPTATSDIDSYLTEDMEDEFSAINIKRIKYHIEVDDDFDETETITQKICYKRDYDTTEYCASSDYKEFATDSIVELNAATYEGQKYYVYSKIKDSKGKENTSSIVEYKLYTDKDPEVVIYTIQNDKTLGYNADEVSFGFIVKDLFDEYKICIKDNDSNCTNSEFSDYFDGSSYCPHKISLKFPGWDYTDKDALNNKKIYITIKDKNNKTIKKNAKYKIYKACDSVTAEDDNERLYPGDDSISEKYSVFRNYCVKSIQGEVGYTVTAVQTPPNDDPVDPDAPTNPETPVTPETPEEPEDPNEPETPGVEIDELDFDIVTHGADGDTGGENGGEGTSEERKFTEDYEYIPPDNGEEPEDPEEPGEDFDPEEETEKLDGSITTYNCKGMCYRQNNDTEFTVPYNRVITYYDKYFDSVACSRDVQEETKDFYCDYKTCFYNRKKETYEYMAIVRNEMEDPDGWTFQDPDGEDHILTTYYPVYLTSYNEEEKKIQFSPTTYRVPTNFEDYDQFKYNWKDMDTYIVADIGE